MKKLFSVLIVVGMMLTFGSLGYAVPSVDVIQAPTGFFTPTDAQKASAPYYRWFDEDWGWSHNPIAGPFATATVSISAYDVDWSSDPSGEHDNIYAKDSLGIQVLLGELAGGNNIWSYTTFNLPLGNGAGEFSLALNNGLDVFIDIDTTHSYDNWAVALSKSVISIDGGTLPDPNPGGEVPEPATMLLLGSGLVGLAGYARRRLKK